MSKQHSDRDGKPLPILRTAEEIRAMLEQDHRTPEEERVRLFKTHARLLLASIRGKNYSDNDPALLEAMQEAYDSWFQQFKFRFAGADIGVLEQEYIRDQRYKLTSGDLMLHDADTRVNVRRFLLFLDAKEKEVAERKPVTETPWKSRERAWAFVIAEAHLNKKINVWDLGKKPFKKRIVEIMNNTTIRAKYPRFTPVDPQTLYTMVKTKSEELEGKNYAENEMELAQKYFEDYDFAREIYHYLFPD